MSRSIPNKKTERKTHLICDNKGRWKTKRGWTIDRSKASLFGPEEIEKERPVPAPEEEKRLVPEKIVQEMFKTPNHKALVLVDALQNFGRAAFSEALPHLEEFAGEKFAPDLALRNLGAYAVVSKENGSKAVVYLAEPYRFASHVFSDTMIALAIQHDIDFWALVYFDQTDLVNMALYHLGDMRGFKEAIRTHLFSRGGC